MCFFLVGGQGRHFGFYVISITRTVVLTKNAFVIVSIATKKDE